MSASAPLVYDGLEFKEKATLAKYASLKRRLGVSTAISIMTLVPALALLFSSYVSPTGAPQYFYLVFLAISIPATVLSFRANSKITEIINSNEVRHVAFA